ncbi:MAG: 3-isopropylmalate dehydratase small subunit [Gammaproteobacteria bacterium]|nr:3-isopropylmalate dehydratase small subunit [Gammaproteobacteria bacterium]MYD01760.1 3-isopropylmalate dehydratase small subunit [Gammaproteobacteria bacterium]MYI25267.1 3-isopropylmalate dehydratase small subunit [Gammaproteobacteria bacterium]
MRRNVDTDAIIPSREMKRVSREGLGEGLFANWRYADLATREEAPDFVLNRDRYREAKILISGENFGCGSSREHAVWALADWGIGAVIAPSFGEIFQANCAQNGLVAVVLPEEQVEALGAEAGRRELRLTVDLGACEVQRIGDQPLPFSMKPREREMILKGLDPIALTLNEHAAAIEAFEKRDFTARPWA